MTTVDRVRRSPLAAKHAAAGATWVSETAWWPGAYANKDLELRALRTGAGILDWGPVDKYVLKGDTTAAEAAAGGLPAGQIAGVDSESGAVIVVRLAADETIFLLPLGGIAGLPGFLEALRPRLVDLSSGLAAFRLIGPSARRILEELCQSDLTDDAFPDLHVTQAPIAAIHAIIARIDQSGLPGFALLVPRDLAEYFWDALIDNGAAHGLTPVGRAAVEALRL